MAQFQTGAPRTGGELLLNTIAQAISAGKYKKSQKANQEEMARILTAGQGEGGQAAIYEAMKTSQNPQIQQMALMQALKAPKEPKNPFGGGEGGSLLFTAYTRAGTPEGQLAYEALKQPKTVRDATTGNITEITQAIPPSLMKLYENQGAAGNGTTPGAGANKEGQGFEQLSENVRVIEGYGKPATETESKSIGFTNRMFDAEKIYDDLTGAGFNPSGKETAFMEGLDEITPDIISQSTMPQDVKRYLGAKTDFITAVLRKESGAAIGQKEFDTENRKYFPQPGDGPKVLEDKKQRRMNALKSMGKAGGQRFEKDFPDIYKALYGEAGGMGKEAGAPAQALDYLKKNNTPEIRQQFKAKYGYLPEEM